jgi:peptide subunit release factor RF-3
LLVEPEHEKFSGFVFKIQANMDPHHRDRIAFVRVCSGKFARDMAVTHVQSGQSLRLAFSHKLFGRERETQDEAWPGDVIGLAGQSELGIGDTITEDPSIRYDEIPRFAPECYAYLRNEDTSNYKRFRAGIAAIASGESDPELPRLVQRKSRHPCWEPLARSSSMWSNSAWKVNTVPQSPRNGTLQPSPAGW